MPQPGLNAAVSRARNAVAPATEARSDGGLLAAFLASGDAHAFSELVARFGPMVFAVCRRVTGHHQDAEDAFQATFVVLARKAASITPREAVGNWLYGVAVRTAREARAMAARRRAREVLVASPPDGVRPDPDPDDLGVVLHEELAELPDKFRQLLVLCDLRGEPQTEVAGRLGLPVGTVYSRLAKARTLLAERLRKRGVALPTAGLVAALASAGQAAVPAGLPAKATAAALSPDSASAAIAALTNGVFRSMLLNKLAFGSACAVLLAVACAAAWGTLPTVAVNEPPKPALVFAVPSDVAPPPRATARQLPKGPNRILIRREPGMRGERSLYLLDPDGKNEKEISEKASKFLVVGARLSPDGKRFAALVHGNQKPGDDPDRSYLHVRGLDEKEPGLDLRVTPDCYVWSRDGTELACSEFEDAGPEKIPYESTHYIVNVRTKEKSALKLPSGHAITGWSPDGKYFLTNHKGETPKPFARLYLMNRDGSEHKALTGEKEHALCGRLSPDGGRVLYAVVVPPPEKPIRVTQHEMVVLDIATGKVTKVQDVPLNIQLLEFCWSPDGKQIAYLWRTIAEGDASEDLLAKETETHLIVCDPDGKNQKTILSEKGTGIGMALSELDWR
jgi:RNA polymerase sigma factor (sigma-70 family)